MNLLEKYKSTLDEISKYDFVDAIIIFGSYSTNTQKPLSDLDVCVFFKKNTPYKEKREVLSYATDELDISSFENLPLSLQFNILTKGRVFYSKIDLSDLKIKITNQWFDFRVGLNKMYKNRGFRGIEV